MKRFLLFALAVSFAWATGVSVAGQIDQGLEGVLNTTPSSQTISVLVYLADYVDIDALTAELDAQKASLRDRHEVVVRSLQDIALSSQGDISSYLRGLKTSGEIKDYKAFWISNCIRVDADKAQIRKIAQRLDVGVVYYNYEIELDQPVEKKDADPLVLTPENGVTAVHAPQCWAMGITGSGVLVATVDTGVDGNHPALASRWAGVADPRYTGHPEWAWYDPAYGQNNFPYDDGGHGTHTMGTVCGGAPGDQVGVAPGAHWMAAAPIDRISIPRTVSDAILSFQWMIDPDGNPATNWDVPGVCSNSWGLVTSHGYPPCDQTFWSYLDACEAAGTVILFSAGNEGSSGLRRPADRATDAYRTCAVAAVDGNTSGWPIASFSSRGPTYCTPDGSAAIKPDIAAPGVNVRSSYPGGGYTTMSGTSMASPHVNGVVALIRQANPNLTVQQVKQIIYETAYDLGSPGEDNSYGWGMIDAYEAVLLAMSMLQGWGTIQGRVTDAVNGAGLPGTVTITNRVPQISATCDAQGYYTLHCPADTAWNLKAEYNLFYLPAYDTASVLENDAVFVNFALPHSPREVFWTDDFSTNTGWTGLGGTGEWTIGAATGGNGNDSYGGPDPAVDHSPTADNKVLGNDLTSGSGGDYAANMGSTYWVTSPTINCTGFTDVLLTFYRWLGVEESVYDHAYLQGYNGTSWVELFHNGGTIDEASWSAYNYDVSALADNNANFKIRFGIGPTDVGWQYCGWNIDDIAISGTSASGPDVTINMIPNNPPVSVPRGGTFTFTGVLTNNVNAPSITDVWIMILVPGYGMFGPVMQANNITLAPNQTLSYPGISQYVPTYAPVGSYTYFAYCGNYPIPDDTASFLFTVTALAGGNANAWTLDGWFEDQTATLPLKTELYGNFPNPFNPTTNFRYSLAIDSEVNLEIYNLLGQKVATVVDERQTAGFKSVIWDASLYSSGVYFYKLTIGDNTFTKRMTLLK